MKNTHISFLFLLASISIFGMWAAFVFPWRIDFVMFIIGMVGLITSISFIIAFSADET